MSPLTSSLDINKDDITWETVETEETLDDLRKRDNYKIERLFKYIFSSIFILLVFFFSAMFFYRSIIDDVFRNQVTDLIADNIVGIVFFVLGLVGINFRKK